MLKSLKKIFEQNIDNTNKDQNSNLDILCGLMIEAANTDGVVDQDEVDKIYSVLNNSFGEDANEIKISLDNAIKNRNNSKSLHYYTSKINKEFSIEKKTLLIETLWEIVLADGEVHDYESSLIRRLAGLLYVSDIAAGNAKKKALNKI